MTTYLKFILGRMKERVRFTLSSHFFTLNEAFFPHMLFFYWVVKQISSSSWSSFRLWTCTREARSQSNPCTEDWSTHLWMWRTYKRYTGHTLVETIQRSCSISLGTFSCVFCSPTEHLRGEVQELWGVQGWRSAYSSQHSHSTRRWGLLYRSRQCDLWNGMCTLNSSVNLTDSTFSVNSKQRSDWNCETSLQRHMPWGQTEQTVGILSLFNALDKHV